eukprot:GHVS01074776.1.p1 GENE.GHVS01074776.1~~GHVS01074776.1.p1  ORF type:complete len:136 (+),score=58.94 GHVS01074776.1:143-550(+)
MTSVEFDQAGGFSPMKRAEKLCSHSTRYSSLTGTKKEQEGAAASRLRGASVGWCLLLFIFMMAAAMLAASTRWRGIKASGEMSGEDKAAAAGGLEGQGGGGGGGGVGGGVVGVVGEEEEEVRGGGGGEERRSRRC